MRALIGLLILGGLFIMAASWQNRMTSKIMVDRSTRYNVPSDSVGTDEGWSRLVLGRGSGADPLPVPEAVSGSRGLANAPANITRRAAPERGGPAAHPPAPPKEQIPPDRVYVVRSDDVLSKICQAHYDVRPLHEVVERVARYNDLVNANAIKAGDELRLPAARALFPDRD